MSYIKWYILSETNNCIILYMYVSDTSMFPLENLKENSWIAILWVNGKCLRKSKIIIIIKGLVNCQKSLSVCQKSVKL